MLVQDFSLGTELEKYEFLMSCDEHQPQTESPNIITITWKGPVTGQAFRSVRTTTHSNTMVMLVIFEPSLYYYDITVEIHESLWTGWNGAVPPENRGGQCGT